MKLLYATAAQFPSRRANRLQTFAMVRALHELLGEQFYFGSHEVSGVNLNGAQHVVFPKTKSIFLAWRYARFIKKNQITHLHCREYRLLFFIMLYNRFFFWQRPDVTYESHKIHHNDLIYSLVVRWSDRVIVLTKYTKEMLEARGVRSLGVLPDAVEFDRFDIDIDVTEVRREFGLSLGKPVVLYAGQLLAWKGAEILMQASNELDDFQVVLIGGDEPDIIALREKYREHSNLKILGYRPPEDIPRLLKAADVLVLPTSARTEIGTIHTSPLKLFEYMASGVPVVATDLPSTREVLDESMATLVAPDDSTALSTGIKRVFKDYESALAKAVFAKKEVRAYTWDARAEQVYNFITT